MPDEFLKRCSCGRTYTRTEWQALKLLGTQDAEVEVLEMRDCATCGSTLAVVVEPDRACSNCGAGLLAGEESICTPCYREQEASEHTNDRAELPWVDP